MTTSIIILLIILAVMAFLFLSQILPIDLTALTGVIVFVLLGFLEPKEAFSGFSSPSVITLVATFFISTAMQTSGLAGSLGNMLANVSGNTIKQQIISVMLLGALISTVMHNVATVALLLPAVVNLGIRTEISPSKLLMPLSFGVVLGGMCTSIGNAPNIIVTDLINESGLMNVSFFTFTPSALIALIAAIFVFYLFADKLIPQRRSLKDLKKENGDLLSEVYQLDERLFSICIESGSPLINKTIRDARLSEIFKLSVISIIRNGTTIHSPKADFVLNENDEMLVLGKKSLFALMLSYHAVKVSDFDISKNKDLLMAKALRIKSNSNFIGVNLKKLGFASSFDKSIIAIEREGEVLTENIAYLDLKESDLLIFIDRKDDVKSIEDTGEFEEQKYDINLLGEFISALSVPADSDLINQTVNEIKLRELFHVSIVAFLDASNRVDTKFLNNKPLTSSDIIIIFGDRKKLRALKNLAAIEVNDETKRAELQKKRAMMAEIVPSPRSQVIGKTVRTINFRERYGLQVIAIWRNGKPIRTSLGDVKIQLGDALLVHGSKIQQKIINLEGDFVSLNLNTQVNFSFKKALLTGVSIFALAVFSIFDIFPVYISAVLSALFLVFTGVITMQEAYKNMEWKLIFLIGALLPIGLVVETSGAAAYFGGLLVEGVGNYGFFFLVISICFFGSLISQSLDTAATLVIFAPVIIEASQKINFDAAPLLILLSYSTSVAFLTPFSHKAHLVTMGAGGYKNSDYFTLGILVTITSFAALIISYYSFF